MCEGHAARDPLVTWLKLGIDISYKPYLQIWDDVHNVKTYYNIISHQKMIWNGHVIKSKNRYILKTINDSYLKISEVVHNV